MQKYVNNIQDLRGNALYGATITVNNSVGALATIYSDNGITTQANPITADAEGEFSFYAANGRYTLYIAYTGSTTQVLSDIILFDPAELSAISASAVSFTPTGTIAATNVQTAIAESASEALQKASNLSDLTNVATARSNLGLTATTGAGLIGYTPTGTIASSTVQAAIDEVVSDLSASSGSSLVGFIQSGAGAVSTNVQGALRNMVVSSITELKAVAKGTVRSTFVTGYYADGDGGGGAYYYDSSDTTSADNGGTIIVATDGGRWKLIVIDYVSIKQFGCKGDGSTNNYVNFGNAVAWCKLYGVELFVPYGDFVIDTTAGSITTEYVNIVGEGVIDGSATPTAAGSVISITGTANSPFKVRRGTSFRSLAFYYPNQVDSATPTVYPATLSADATDGAVNFVVVKDCTVFNAYEFFNSNDATGSIGHVWFTDNTIYAINRVYYIRYNAEAIHFHGNDHTFGHWLAATEGGCRGYTRANGTVLQIDQSDGVYWGGNLCFGYLNGWLTSAQGFCQLMKYGSENAMDQVRYGIHATGTGNLAVDIAGGNDWVCENPLDTTLQGNAIRITTSGATAEIINIAPQLFAAATEDLIYVSGNTPTRDINVAPCQFTTWAAGKVAGTYGALNINGNNTNLRVTGGYMMGGNNPSHSSGILGSFNTFQCNGVSFIACVNPINMACNIATGGGNVSYATGGAASDVVSAGTLTWGPNNFDKPNFKTPQAFPIANVGNYANDAAAAAAGVPVGGLYRNASVVQIRTV